MKRLIPVFFFLFLLPTVIYGEILLLPYTQAVNANSAYILVETDTPDSVTVNYGLTPSLGTIAKTQFILQTTASPPTYVHRIKLANLQANTRYYYNATHQSSTSPITSFMTAIISDTAFRFCWMADCRTGISIHNQITTLLRQRNPRFSIYGGDLCYGPDYYYWKTEFFTLEEQTTIFQIPFYAVVGNHEGWTTNTKAFEQNPVSSSGTQDYYSFDYGNVHFTVVNVMVNYNPGSPQYTFVSEDLSSTSKRWKIVVVHNPPYCAGGHGEDSVLITMAQNLFVPNNVDLVIAGHSHFYQHNLVNGIHYLVIGSAGAPLYTPGSNSYTIKSVQDYCWGVFDVESTSLVVRVYNNYDSLLDSLKLDKPLSGIEKKVSLVKETMLIQNFPNPFNSVTKIRFIIEKKSPVVLKIVNVLGKEITTLVNESLGEGTYEVDFDGSGLASGIYFCRLLVGDKQLSKKIMLLK